MSEIDLQATVILYWAHAERSTNRSHDVVRLAIVVIWWGGHGGYLSSQVAHHHLMRKNTVYRTLLWSKYILKCVNLLKGDAWLDEIFITVVQFIQYKKHSTEKKLPQMLAAWKVIRSESGARIITPIFLEGGIFLCLGVATALEKDGSGNWDATFWYDYFSSCQHLGQAFFSAEGFLYWIYTILIKH